MTDRPTTQQAALQQRAAQAIERPTSGAFLLKLRRWLMEAIVALFPVGFVFNLVLYQTSVSARPDFPEPSSGFVLPYSTKFGLRYVSWFEGFVLNHFFIFWAWLLLAGLLLKSTYHGSRIRYDVKQRRLVSEFAYEQGDLSYRRCLCMAILFAAICAVSWWAANR